ncbi:hypothetical protein OB236_13915 [Paenibacillus sp. WQ 127069]|uniref:Uncharacterized protein n=1 Tax=Paenibacillus baimaensis TaxID=2982185 RepID=A0ABT2UEZ8_9BACL|nr:hypothetical protein [Paenibacillus sp. WQ 127069]MCU6793214.1 hypothetical protein [Paenibacillus sp. WQ 127069]
MRADTKRSSTACLVASLSISHGNTGIDPTISEQESADDSVDFTIGINVNNKFILLNPIDSHLEFTEQVKVIIKKYQEWLPERAGIETNAYQKSLKQ